MYKINVSDVFLTFHFQHDQTAFTSELLTTPTTKFEYGDSSCESETSVNTDETCENSPFRNTDETCENVSPMVIINVSFYFGVILNFTIFQKTC